MTPTRQGSFRLFRFAGIDLYLHWSWFLIAVYELSNRGRIYSSPVWNAIEYLALFAIVTLHEFGHALACRQVGGQANQIVLWPLGGVAYVAPPPRPGATLWSIAAGPLVNVVLIPVFSMAVSLAVSAGWAETQRDAFAVLRMVQTINFVLLIFNLLPVYPLDGGQILRCLLWFVLGRARSLLVATVIGFVGAGGLILLAVLARSMWIGILAVFMLATCWNGLRQAFALARAARAPRHAAFACPECRAAPPQGNLWMCGRCRARFDLFASGGCCPHCGAQGGVVPCPECGAARPLSEWGMGGG